MTKKNVTLTLTLDAYDVLAREYQTLREENRVLREEIRRRIVRDYLDVYAQSEEQLAAQKAKAASKLEAQERQVLAEKLDAIAAQRATEEAAFATKWPSLSAFDAGYDTFDPFDDEAFANWVALMTSTRPGFFGPETLGKGENGCPDKVEPKEGDDWDILEPKRSSLDISTGGPYEGTNES